LFLIGRYWDFGCWSSVERNGCAVGAALALHVFHFEQTPWERERSILPAGRRRVAMSDAQRVEAAESLPCPKCTTMMVLRQIALRDAIYMHIFECHACDHLQTKIVRAVRSNVVIWRNTTA
jgi:hypothetical protein